MQSWSIIIYFYNEEGNLDKVCLQALDFLKPLEEDKKEIIFVNDGSDDQSLEKIKAITKNKSYVKFINHKKNIGIGASLKSGYKTAVMDNVCAVAGDGQFNINELRAFRSVPPKTVISFFRVEHKYYSFFRKSLTKTNRWINKLLFGIELKDVNWVKIYKRSDISGLIFQSKSSYLESEIIYYLKRKGLKMIQSPSFCLPRSYGHSKSVTSSSLKAVSWDLIKLFFNRS